MAESSAKSQVAIAVLSGIFIIIAAIVSSPHWFKYFFPEQYLEEEIVHPNTETTTSDVKIEKDGTEKVVISDIQLCPVNTSLPSYLYFEIKNEGSKTIKDLSLEIDLGRAKIIDMDLTGSYDIQKLDSTRMNEVYVQYSALHQNESKAAYFLLSQPVFRSIKINGTNLVRSKEYLYSEYLEYDSEAKSKTSGFITFLQILLGFVLLIFSLFFVTAVYKALKQKNLINWDI